MYPPPDCSAEIRSHQWLMAARDDVESSSACEETCRNCHRRNWSTLRRWSAALVIVWSEEASLPQSSAWVSFNVVWLQRYVTYMFATGCFEGMSQSLLLSYLLKETLKSFELVLTVVPL